MTEKFFPYKSIRDLVWSCHRIGQGQPRVIIWIKLVVLEHPMLHTKFQDQDHQPFGSGEEDFLRFLPYMGGHLGHVTRTFEQILIPPSHGDSIWNLASVGPVVSEEKMFKECGRQTSPIPPSHGDFIWNLASVGPVVSEEKMFEECGRQTNDGRTDIQQRPTYPISSPISLRLMWANNKNLAAKNWKHWQKWEKN